MAGGTAMRERAYTGLLCIGDPHLASRVPGFRKDDYPRTILQKLEWALDYAAANRLLPVMLGDVFHYPRDNANWLLVELLDLMDEPVLAVAGNHDCTENTLTDDDTLSVLSAAGHIHLLDRRGAWVGLMNGVRTMVGGTCWGAKLPERIDRAAAGMGEVVARVFWVAHHDIRFPGYEEASRFGCREIPGVDAVINGHIHRPLEDVVSGGTTWVNPGNISRVSRGDASRERRPSVLRIDVQKGGWTKAAVMLPHMAFDEVFYPEVKAAAEAVADDSPFVRGLAELESLRTESGAGLERFLDQNVEQFEPAVAAEIRKLAKEVLDGER